MNRFDGGHRFNLPVRGSRKNRVGQRAKANNAAYPRPQLHFGSQFAIGRNPTLFPSPSFLPSLYYSSFPYPLSLPGGGRLRFLLNPLLDLLGTRPLYLSVHFGWLLDLLVLYAEEAFLVLCLRFRFCSFKIDEFLVLLTSYDKILSYMDLM